METHRLLAELDEPVSDREWQLLQTLYGQALQPTYELVRDFEAPHDADSRQITAVVHLVSRGLSDLLASGHLATHRYLPQTYSLLRPVLDSCDLITLFAADAREAHNWVSTDKAHKDFAPAKVRRRLGRASYDRGHGLLSELGSHPRFAGVRMNLALDAQDQPVEESTPFSIGPAPISHPSALFAWRFAFDSAFRLGATCMEVTPLAADPDAAFQTWLQGQLRCLDAVRSGTVLVLRKLRDDFAAVDATYAEAAARLRAQLET